VKKWAGTLLFLASMPLAATTFTVTNTNDSGAGSLRQALLDAQNCAGAPHSIEFNVPAGSLTGGVALITPASPLPSITCAGTVIDGETQTLNVGNTNDVTLGTGGTVGTGADGVPNTGDESALPQLNGPEVEIDGSNLSGAVLTIQADAATVEALSVHGGGDFSGVGTGSGNIDVQSGDGVAIAANVLGARATSFTNPGGAAQTQNNLIRITGGSNIVIENNLLGFTRWRSILIFNSSVDTVSIQGNEFLGSFDGVDYSSPGIGPTGLITVETNLFHDFVDNGSGSTIFGVYLTQTGGSSSVADNTFQGLGYGALVDVARPAVFERNIISGNTHTGIALSVQSAAMPSTIRRNSIHDNGDLGIDLGSDGVTPNDAADADGGPNGLQNYPIVQSVTTGATTHVTGKFRGAASTTFDLDFYVNGGCSNFPREFLEGETYIGSSQVTTDGAGDAVFDEIFPVPTLTGQLVSVTATDPAGNTSEFSQRIIFSISPASGPASGGTPIAVAGTDFADPTTMTIGGVAVFVSFNDDRSLSTTAPALSPGTVNDVVVTTPDGTTGTLLKGWVSDFLDVPGGHQFYSFVTTLVSNTITVGVGGGNYGIDQPTLRRQMAVFLLKARNGLCYTPPPCQGDFADVPCPSTFADWVEALADEGISGGCGGGNFCPTNPVRRDQMAPFLLKAEHGSSYLPPPCTGVFPDVTCPSLFADWIEQLAAEQITGGCGGGNYCPSSNSTRGQMAVFVTKTFNLQ
jgi:Right handed beta helix region/IPT/TIG domain/S-layer homology domain